MPLSRARAVCPEAQVTPFSPVQIRRAQDGLLTALTAFSQWLEAERHAAQTAHLYVDLGRITPQDGHVLAGQILARIGQQGFTPTIGLAAGKFTARVAAQAEGDHLIRLVRRGDEAAYLARFTVTLLPLDAEVEHRLSLLGIRRMGQVAALPRQAFIDQFGPIGGLLHRLACGEDHRQVAKYAPPVMECAERSFEAPVEDRLILEASLRLLSHHLARRLLDQHMACHEVTLSLRLAEHAEHALRHRPREGISTAQGLHQALLGMLGRMRIQSGVMDVEVQAGRLAPIQPRQLSLFDHAEALNPRPVLVDISQRYGEDLFYTIAPLHNPSRPPELLFRLEGLGDAA